MRITIPTHRKEAVEAFLLEACRLFEADGTLRGGNIHKCFMLIYCISDAISIAEFPFNNSSKRKLILHTVKSIRNETDNIADCFLSSLANNIKNDKGRPWNYYSLLCAFNTNNLVAKRIINGTKIDEFCFSTISTGDLSTILNWETDELRYKRELDEGFDKYVQSAAWTKITFYASDVDQAFSRGVGAFESIRSVANFILTYKIITEQSQPMQLSKLSPSKYFFLLDEKDEFITLRWTIGEYNYNKITLSESQLKNIIRFAKEIGKIPESALKAVLLECFRLYNEAMDSNRRDYTFILLWSIIDLLYPEAKKITKALKALYRQDARYMKHVVDALYAKRNMLIHQGRIDDIEMEDVNYLRIIVQDLIWYVKVIALHASTITEFKRHLELLRLDEKELEKYGKAIRTVCGLKYPKKEGSRENLIL